MKAGARGPAAKSSLDDSELSPKPLSATLIQELQNLKDKFKNEDDGQEKESPYQHLEKATVLQECRVFHDAQVVTQNPRKCCQMITKLLFLLVKGESFTSTEVTEVFFGVTKLFQSHDVNLRRMMYLFIKEVAETCNPDDVIIVTSSLTKDMNTGEDLYRANSMRVLAKIIDAAMLGAIERYLKQAIVDRNAFVASSALMAGLRLFKTCPEVVRRWINEVQEAVNSSSEMVQYHSLSLLYKIKQHDRLAVSKIVQQMSKGALRSPLAACLLIRYTSNLLHEDMTSTNAKTSYAFLETCLRHRSEMVIYEAAKAMCNLPNVDRNDLSPAITVLQLFLASPKPSLRFAAMRTLADVATKHPMSVAKCNDDMELLVSDGNRSIATLAITTLLKTGTESSIDRLMKQISTFMGEITDEFKLVVTKAVRELCVKYPKKFRLMINFLATCLRDEGGFEFKRSVVDMMTGLTDIIAEATELVLLHFCEFIEDCEWVEVIVQCLGTLATKGPRSSMPARFIRFIFNRLLLENAIVRACAISTLGDFAFNCPDLRASIRTNLRRCLHDEDDEVRDRTTILLSILDQPEYDDSKRYFLAQEPMPMSFTALDRSVRAYMAHPMYDATVASAGVLTFASLPIVEEAYVPPANLPKGTKKANKDDAPSSSSNDEAVVAAAVDPAAAVYAVPQFVKYGRAFRSCAEVPLTEAVMEYVISCVKHVFADYVVLQFKIMNTLDNQQLRDVRINVEVDGQEMYTVETVIPAAVARYGEHANCFVSLKRNEEAGYDSVTLPCEMTFKMVEVDATTGEPESDDPTDEEYALEAVEVNTNDYMAKVNVPDFRRNWDAAGTDGEVLEKFALQFKKKDDAVNAVIDFLGMQAVDNTQTVAPDEPGAKKPHTIHLSGVFVGNIPVLVRAQVQMDDANGAVLKIAVRSQIKEVSQIVAECIH